MGISFRETALIILFAGGVNTAFGQLLWSDEFDSGTSLDPDIWSYDLGDSGWGNQELQNYTDDPDNVRLENGNLVINIRSTGEGENSRFTSARVKTQDKLTFKYGRIEARIQMPDLADGLWPAFWTLGNNISVVGWPRSGEIDIVEMGSGDAISAGLINRRVGSTAHWSSGGYATYGSVLDLAEDINGEYHIFSMDWTPDTLTTYIDGRQIWAMIINQDQCASCDEFHKPHHMILNVAVGGSFTGIYNASGITAAVPAQMLVDYVRIYDNGYTQMGGSFIDDQPVPGQDYYGSWFNQYQSGHGFSIAFGRFANGTPLAVVYWYTYDSEGYPMFLLGAGEIEDSVLEVQFESPYGMQYGVFDPDSVIRENGGTARFEFSDAQNATFSYTPSEFSVQSWGHTPIESLPLNRLFTVPVTDTASVE